jgi:hypothetical protein
MIGLYTRWQGTGFFSLWEQGTATAYQVPVGKKFIALKFTGSYGNYDLYINSTLNGTTGGQKFHTGSGSGSYGNQSNTEWDCYFEAVAGDYITSYFNSNDQGVSLIGVETDA